MRSIFHRLADLWIGSSVEHPTDLELGTEVEP